MDDGNCQAALVGLQYLLDSAIDLQRRFQGGHGLVTVKVGRKRALQISRALAYLLDEAPERKELNSSLPDSREINAVLRKLFPSEEAGNL